MVMGTHWYHFPCHHGLPFPPCSLPPPPDTPNLTVRPLASSGFSYGAPAPPPSSLSMCIFPPHPPHSLTTRVERSLLRSKVIVYFSFGPPLDRARQSPPNLSPIPPLASSSMPPVLYKASSAIFLPVGYACPMSPPHACLPPSLEVDGAYKDNYGKACLGGDELE